LDLSAGNISGNYDIEGNLISGSDVGVSIGTSSSLGTGSAQIQIHTKDKNMFAINGSANGSILAADANISNPVSKNGLRMKGEVGLYSAKGDLNFGIKILGADLQFTTGASFVSAHAGFDAGIFYDEKNKNVNFIGLEHLGLGIGEKFGFKISIPWEK
jgi:hypothetical protein